MRRWVGLVLWLVLTTAQTHAYARAWQSDLTLWAHAVQQAPQKPRPALNYGVSLIQAGQLEAGVDMLTHAAQVAQWPHVPWYDRVMTQQTLARNLRGLTGASE